MAEKTGPRVGWRTTGQIAEDMIACDHCCSWEHCNDMDHYKREDCPHCNGTGVLDFLLRNESQYKRFQKKWKEFEASARAMKLNADPGKIDQAMMKCLLAGKEVGDLIEDFRKNEKARADGEK